MMITHFSALRRTGASKWGKMERMLLLFWRSPLVLIADTRGSVWDCRWLLRKSLDEVLTEFEYGAANGMRYHQNA